MKDYIYINSETLSRALNLIEQAVNQGTAAALKEMGSGGLGAPGSLHAMEHDFDFLFNLADKAKLLTTDAECAVFIDRLGDSPLAKYFDRKLSEAIQKSEDKFEPWTAGTEAINRERGRQITKEGFESEHDDMHRRGELGWAARCYLVESLLSEGDGNRPNGWPWDDEWWKPGDKTLKGRKRNLEKAGALIAAEWDRLDRIIDSEQPAEQPDDPPFEYNEFYDRNARLVPQDQWTDLTRDYVARRQAHEMRTGGRAFTAMESNVAMSRVLRAQPMSGNFADVPDGAPAQPPPSIQVVLPPVGARYHTIGKNGEHIDITEDIHKLHSEIRKCETAPSSSSSSGSLPSSPLELAFTPSSVPPSIEPHKPS